MEQKKADISLPHFWHLAPPSQICNDNNHKTLNQALKCNLIPKKSMDNKSPSNLSGKHNLHTNMKVDSENTVTPFPLPSSPQTNLNQLFNSLTEPKFFLSLKC